MENADMVYDVLSFRWLTGLEIIAAVEKKYSDQFVAAVHFYLHELVEDGFVTKETIDNHASYRRTNKGRPAS